MFEKDCQDREQSRLLEHKYQQLTIFKDDLAERDREIMSENIMIQMLSEEIKKETQQHIKQMNQFREAHLEDL